MQEDNKAFHIKECTLQRTFTFCVLLVKQTELFFVIIFKVCCFGGFLTLIWPDLEARQEKREMIKQTFLANDYFSFLQKTEITLHNSQHVHRNEC